MSWTTYFASSKIRSSLITWFYVNLFPLELVMSTKIIISPKLFKILTHGGDLDVPWCPPPPLFATDDQPLFYILHII